MAQILHQSIVGQVIAAGESGSYVIADGLLCAATLLAKVAGDAGFGAVFSFDASPDDGTTWYSLKVVDMSGTSEETLVSSITFGAAGAKALAAIPYVLSSWQFRVTVACTTHPITVDLWLVGG